MRSPYLIFLGDVDNFSSAKTGAGLKEWRGDQCLGQVCLEGCKVDLGLRNMSFEEAVQLGAKTLIIGVVNIGGFIAESWKPALLEAMAAGLDIASGMHARLSDDPEIAAAAKRHKRSLFDARHTKQKFSVGTGIKRTGKRLLTVGSDCVVGKKYTALAVEREMKKRSMNVDFRATGQTGVLIAGNGVAIDAVVADFISGAAEAVSPENDADHWDIIEGQGALSHPAYAGVTLGLIHGSQPDGLVICHEPIREKMLGLDYPVIDLEECIRMNVAAAQLTNKEAKAVGISVNTSQMTDADTERAIKSIQNKTGLPCCDPIKHGIAKIVDYAAKVT